MKELLNISFRPRDEAQYLLILAIVRRQGWFIPHPHYGDKYTLQFEAAMEKVVTHHHDGHLPKSDKKFEPEDFEEVVQLVLGIKEPDWEPRLRIGSDVVEFGKDYIRVGCTTVSHRLVKAIYRHAFPGDLLSEPISFTKEELGMIRFLTGRVTGDDVASPRRITHAIWEKLSAFGYAGHLYDYSVTPDFCIYFKRDR